MTKKKHYIKTIEDIKYCEENGIELYDEYQATVCFRFVDGVWCSYTNKNLNVYNVRLSLNSLYYEEKAQEQTETDTTSVGKLCYFWDDDWALTKKLIAILERIEPEMKSWKYYSLGLGSFEHCRPLTKAEIQEFMEKAE